MKAAAVPLKHFARHEAATNGNGLNGWADKTGSVDSEIVAQADIHFAKAARLFENLALCFRARRGNSHPRKALGSLTLLAMMMREEHPLHPLHPDLAKVIQHASVAQVNQKRRIPIAYDIRITRIAPEEHLRSGA